MISDAWVPVAVGGFFVAVFVALQVMGWHSSRVIVGGSRRSGQIAMATGVTLLVVILLCLLAPTLNIRSLSGAPFVLLFTITVLSSFIMPALMVIELILLAESVLTKKVEPRAWVWHLGALIPCAAWAVVLLVPTGLVPK